MNLQEWRAKRKRTTPVTLPSGLEVQLRQVDVVDLATQGQIPSGLSDRVMTSITEGKAFTPSLEDMPSMRTVMVAVAIAAVVEPAELDVATELDFTDLNHIFAWANGGAQALEPFREEPDAAVGTGRPEHAVQPEAE